MMRHQLQANLDILEMGTETSLRPLVSMKVPTAGNWVVSADVLLRFETICCNAVIYLPTTLSPDSLQISHHFIVRSIQLRKR
jgi:hypothetical protein